MNKTKTVSFAVPLEAAEHSGFAPDGEFTLHAGESLLAMTPREMTALQAAQAIGVLTQVAADLIASLKDACGECGERRCAGTCPYVDTSSTSFAPPQAAGLTHSAVSPFPSVPGKCPYWDTEPEVALSDSAREKLGIPKDAKLQLLPDEGEGLVCAADYEHDITDIPAQVLAALDLAGVCRGRLDESVMNGEVICHG